MPGDNVFRIVSIVGVAGAVVCGMVHYLVRGRRTAARPGRPAGWWQRLVYAALAGSIAVLTATGFYPAMRGEAVGGWLLIVHVTFGGVFAAALAAAALTWAERASFARSGDRFDTPRKLCFWGGLAAALATLLSMMLSMTDWFSAEQIESLLELHRWAALGVVLLTMVDAYRAGLAARRGGGAREDDDG
jgi:hypothetical protein